jgi:type I restriction enzyme S subunit
MKFNHYIMEDVLEAIIDYRGKTPHKSPSGIQTLSAKSVKDGYIDYSQCYYISPEEYQKFMVRGFPQKGDVLLTTEAPLGMVARLDKDNVALAQRLLTLRGKKGVLDTGFLYYYLRSPIGKARLKARETGTTVTGIKQAEFRKTEIEVPEYAVQVKIAKVLEDIDKKSDLNREINKNLADQSQAILTHFMDVYQCEFQPLSDIADIIDCLHSKKPNSEKDSSYQLIQLDNIRDDGFLDMSACKYMISAEDYRNWTRKCEIREGDCVITNVGRIGAVSQAPAGVKAAMGRNMTCIRLKDDIKLNAYIITTLLSKHMKRQIESNTDEGTIMGALNVKNIPKLLLPIFVPTRMSELERLLFPIRKQIEYNNIQNQILSQTRDTLLPHLMSGEIDISNVEL